MAIAYDRRYELTLSRPKPNSFFDVLPNAIIARGLEIKFKVERSTESPPNTAEVTVFNLSDATRNAFTKKPLHVRLDVGYASDRQLSRLIEGDLMFESSKWDGQGNLLTTFTIGDGERAYVDSRISVSLGSGVNLKTAVGELASSMGLSVPTSASGFGELLKQFSSGLTMHGPSSKIMDRLMKDANIGWSVQDGQLQLLRAGDTAAGLVELITSRDLIGSPDYAPAKEAGKPPVLKFKRLLRPQLIPGRRVKIESSEINGLFRIVKVSHTGDFRDNDWYSDCEANPV